MNINSVVVHSAALTETVSGKLLSEGSSVYVRILKNNGNGSFTASVQGAKIQLTSAIPLIEGSGFHALLKIKDGKILLVQQNEKASQSFEIKSFEKLFDSDGNIMQDEVKAYFEKLGLFPDRINYSMLETLKNLGMKYDISVLEKARRVSEKSGKNQKEAAQTGIVLEEKGIGTGEKAVSAILGDEENGGKQNSGKFSFENKQQKGDFPVFQEVSVELFKEKFDELISGKIFRKEGILSLFNHTGFASGKSSVKGSWIKIPFEYEDKSGSGKGSLAFFLEPDRKECGKCVLRIEKDEGKYAFILYFKEKKCVKIKSSIKLPEKLEKEFEVEYADFSEISQFDSGEEKLIEINGMI